MTRRPDDDELPGFLERALSLAFDSDSLSEEVGERPFQAPERAGRFLILGEIGRGGGGVVYRAHDPEIDRDVALKIMRAGPGAPTDARERFRREVRVSGQLQHPYFVPVHECGTLESGEPFYVMRLVEGATLAQLMREGNSSQRRLLVLLEQVAQAVGYAHSNGMVHRDLKPSNVMVGSFGEVQVMDWGLVEVLGDSVDVGVVLGTPAYMPPEQARGQTELVDERADVFALGAMLCEVLTGKPPFVGDRDQALGQSRNAKLAPVVQALHRTGADSELLSLAERALSEEIESRPRNAMDFARELTAYFATQEERTRQAELDAEAGRVEAREERRRRRLTLALSGVVLLAAAAGGAVWWNHERSTWERVESLSADVQAAHGTALEAFVRAQASGPDDVRSWDLAKHEIEQAALLLASGEVREGVAERVAELRARVLEEREVALAEAAARERDRAMVQRLAEVETPLKITSWPATRAGYERAFGEYGLDLTSPVLTEVQDREIAPVLAMHLDRWALYTDLYSDPVDAERLRLLRPLLARASELDSDGRRAAIRAAIGERDIGTLRALAEPDQLQGLGVETSWLLGAGLRAAGEVQSAEGVIRSALLTFPGDCWLNFMLGSLIMDQRTRYEEAILHASAALSACDDDADARHLLGELFQREGRYREALEHFELLALRHPNKGHHHAHVSANLAELGRHEEALAAARRATEASPADPHAWRTLAFREEERGCRRAALEAVRRVHELGDRRGTRELVTQLKITHQVEEALEVMEELLSDVGGRADRYNLALLWWNRGGLQEFTADFGAAGESYRTALQLDASVAEAHCGLAHVLEQTGDIAGAVEHYRRGHEIGSARSFWNNPSQEWVDHSLNLARCAEQLDAFERGELEPASDEDAYVFGLAASWTGRHSLAVRAFEAAEARAPELANNYRQPMIESAAWLVGAAELSAEERLSYGERGLAWLEARLRLQQSLLRSAPEQSFPEALSEMRSMELRRTYANLRDAEGLEELRSLGARGQALADAAADFWGRVAAEADSIVALELELEARKD